MKLKDEEYNKMSQDFESSLKLGRTTSGEHVVMKHEKECAPEALSRDYAGITLLCGYLFCLCAVGAPYCSH